MVTLGLAILATLGMMAPASAGTIMNNAAAALKTQDLYVDPGAAIQPSAADMAAIDQLLANTLYPTKVAILPGSVKNELTNGSADWLAADVANQTHVGATYAVLAGTPSGKWAFRAVDTSNHLGERVKSLANSAYQRNSSNPLTALRAFLVSLPQKAAPAATQPNVVPPVQQPAQPQNQPQAQQPAKSGGGHGWLWLVLIVVVIGLVGGYLLLRLFGSHEDDSGDVDFRPGSSPTPPGPLFDTAFEPPPATAYGSYEPEQTTAAGMIPTPTPATHYRTLPRSTRSGGGGDVPSRAPHRDSYHGHRRDGRGGYGDPGTGSYVPPVVVTPNPQGDQPHTYQAPDPEPVRQVTASDSGGGGDTGNSSSGFFDSSSGGWGSDSGSSSDPSPASDQNSGGGGDL